MGGQFESVLNMTIYVELRGSITVKDTKGGVVMAPCVSAED